MMQNASNLHEFNFDLTTAIQAQPNSLISFRSEFRSLKLLDPLLSLHPNWAESRNILLNWATFPLQPISEDERRSDLIFHF